MEENRLSRNESPSKYWRNQVGPSIYLIVFQPNLNITIKFVVYLQIILSRKIKKTGDVQKINRTKY